MTDPSKAAASDKGNDEEDIKPDVRSFRFNSRTPASPRVIKSSTMSSEEDTSSSSLLPIPDTLRQMRGELKRIINDTVEPGNDPLSCTGRVISEDVPNSLQELRRKYSLKNEASVTMKMNSANLMLDDILSASNGGSADVNFTSKFFREPEFRMKRVQESDTTSIAETLSTIQHCDHRVTLTPVTLNHPNPSMEPLELSRHYCKTREKMYRPTCICSNHYDKGLQVVGNSREEKQKKLSFIEKLQNLHLRYRIQSVYKIVQKNNPFNNNSNSNNKNRKDDSSATEQGIPHSNYQENTRIDRRKREDKRCTGNHYPRRMVFDLVESSDASQSDDKSTVIRDDEGNCMCPVEIKCTCQSQKDCTCPELLPTECTCCEPRKFVSESPEYCVPPDIEIPIKVSELVQTETITKETRGKVENANPTEPGVHVTTIHSAPRTDASGQPTVKLTDQINIKPVNNGVYYRNPGQNLQKHLESDYHDWRRHCFKERRFVERTDIYYFDHGNSSYYRTTDNHPVRYTECLVERTDEYATKFWGEIFGVVEVGVAFIISFILQLYRFFFTSIIRSLTVGLLQIFSDYFFKPLLTIMFNGIIQPCLILAYNIATSVRDLCFPISQTFGFFLKEVANLIRSCRLVDISHNCKKLPSCHCENKV